MPTHKLDRTIIEAAIVGFESQKTQIDARITELRQMLDGPAEAGAASVTPTRKRRKFSATARRRMREAQQRRWAKVREASEPPAPAKPKSAKPKRRISKEGMARIVAATKKRWAAVKAAKKQQAKAASKKVAVKKPKAAKKIAAVKKTPAKAIPTAAQVAKEAGAQ